MLEINKEDIKDHLDWLKIQITISSAAIGAITLKATAETSTELKAASILFICSIIFMIIGFPGIVEHKNSTTTKVPYKSSMPVILGYACFLLALGSLVINVL